MNIIKNEVESEIKIKRSRFIASVKPVTNIDEAKEYINKISKENNNANHNCWTYRIGEKGDVFHYSDNGEPSGTAGLPMFRILQKYDLTNIVVVVTRYFGGIKLGIRGLMEAYGESVDSALKIAVIERLVKYEFRKISTSYHYSEILKYKLNQMGVVIENTEYAENVMFYLKFEREIGEVDLFLESLQSSGNITIE